MKTTIEDALTRQQIRDAEDFLMKNLSDIFFKDWKALGKARCISMAVH